MRPFEELDERPAVAGTEAGYDVGRLLAFSDGVFAIAVTLLVLDIPVPALARVQGDAQLGSALVNALPQLGAFALSFLMVGVYWIRHHQTFRNVVRGTTVLLWLNLVLLFLVCLVPFSAAVFSRYADTHTGVEVYCANLAALGIAFSAIRFYVQQKGLLRVPMSTHQQQAMVLRAISLPLSIIAFAVLFRYNGWVAGGALFAVTAIVNVIRRWIGSLPDTARSGVPRS
jgi:uncharacterized membrane protein